MRSIVKASLLGLPVVLLSACGLVLGLPGSDEVKNDFDGGKPGDSSVADTSPQKDGALVDGPISDAPFDATCNADLTIDGKNCGACGHDCLGGACTASKCQPVKVVGSSSLAPFTMTLSGNTLYFTNIKGNSLGSLAKAQKTATNNDVGAVILSDWSSKQGTPYQVAANGTDVYFAVYSGSAANMLWDGALMRCPSETCPPALTVSGVEGYGIATDGANVYTSERAYVGNVDKYLIRKRNMDLSSPVLMGEAGSSANWMTLTPSEIIWGDDDGIYHCAKGGCGGPPQKLASPWSLSADQIAIVGNTVYFTSNPFNGVATVQSVAIGGGLPQTLAKDLDVPFGIAADATYFYVAEIQDISNPSTGRIFRCPVAGCGINNQNLEVLFTGENPRAVLSDTNAIYFGTREGNIYRLAK
ncbi:hypothetical protein BH09MYX1_BH09MYX1_41370 [soil metagenome]